MRPFPKDDRPEKICLSLVETTTAKMRRAVAEASPEADLIEIRMDYIISPELRPILRAGKKPVVITNRRKEERGRFTGTEEARFAVLRQAVELGAAFVDIEAQSKKSCLREFMVNKKNTRTLLSFHNFTGTPDTRDSCAVSRSQREDR